MLQIYCSFIFHEIKSFLDYNKGCVLNYDWMKIQHSYNIWLLNPTSHERLSLFKRIATIREWIAQEVTMPNLPFEYDFENVIDDWVLMCFFVGNDFLPHLPSLDIKEGAIDKLVGIYKSKICHCLNLNFTQA